MVKKVLLLVFSLLSFHLKSFSQTNPASGGAGWNPIGLTVSGHNTINGVDASYQLNTCNGEDVVFVKLVNHNTYAVTVEWYPAVFTQDQQWIKKENLTDKISVALAPNIELAGDCSGTKSGMLIRLSDFSVQPLNFFRYGATNFSVITGQ